LSKALKVLIVEDSENDALLLLRALRRGGFESVEHLRVQTGPDMQAALDSEVWDVILSDYTMPEFSFVAAIELLKKTGLNIPMIVVTGTIGEERAVETLKLGAYDYLLKDHLVRLPSSIKNVLNDVRAKMEALSSAEQIQKLSCVVEQTADGVFITDTDGFVEYANPSFELMSGYSLEELLGNNLRILKSGHHDAIFYEEFWLTLQSGKPFYGVFINRKKDGGLFYEEKVVSPLTNSSGKITHYVSTGRDISDRIRFENQLKHQATHDFLTGLPNRILLEDRLQQAMTFSDRYEHRVGVVFIDLDNFKRINDAYGHGFGDRLLRLVAQNLGQCCREIDTLGRLGGDEFIVVLSQITDVRDAHLIVRRLQSAFKSSYKLDNIELFITASVGLSIYPDDSNNASDLMQNADAAMYRVKETGRNGFQLYSPELNAQHKDRLTLEAELQHGLELDQFLLFYQPQVNIRTGALSGVEVLLRWKHPVRGMIPPIEFIYILEETGLISQVGNWVLQTACKQKQQWANMGLDGFNLAINISSRQFLRKDLLRLMQQLKADPAYDLTHIELEITESVLMTDASAAINTLDELCAMGLRLAIDDFGTGYSSLSYLKRFPIHTLKIDKSFVMDIGKNNDHGDAIVAAILSMAQSLGLQTVAEGVETALQLAFLTERGCDLVQGYYFSKPLPVDEMEAVLRQRQVGSFIRQSSDSEVS